MIFHMPSGTHFGPYHCSTSLYGTDSLELDSVSSTANLSLVADQINSLISLPPQRLSDTSWFCRPPRLPREYILVLVAAIAHSSRSSRNAPNLKIGSDNNGSDWSGSRIDVYVVELQNGEGMTLDMVKAYVRDKFGPDALSDESLQSFRPHHSESK